MPNAKVTYRGWPGHFICADMCKFRLNTLVEYGNIRIVVSTVGLMLPPGATEWQTIGLNRYFETMAFHASYAEGFWDAYVQRQVSFNSPWRYSSKDD